MAYIHNNNYYLTNNIQDHRIENIFIDDEKFISCLILQDNKFMLCSVKVHINKFSCHPVEDNIIYICGDIIFGNSIEHFKYPCLIQDFFILLVSGVEHGYTISFSSDMIASILRESSFYKSNVIYLENHNNCQGFLINENLCKIGTFNSINLIYNKTDDIIDTTLEGLTFEYKYTNFNHIAFNIHNSNMYLLFKLNKSYYIDDELPNDYIEDVSISSTPKLSVEDINSFFKEQEFKINNTEFVF